MCDPTGGIATAAATVFTAGAQIVSGMGQRKLASAQAAGDDAQAREELRGAAERAARVRMQGQKFLAEQRVQIAAGGTEVGSGSALEVGMADAGEIELDAMTEMYGGSSRASALKQQASFKRSSGVAAQTAGFVNAASTILSTSSKWGNLGG
jgi:hypothetical protein